MTIAKKLYLLIIAVVVGLAMLTSMGIYQINRVNTAASYSTVNTVPSLLTISEFSDSAFSLRIALWKYIATKDPAVKKSAEKAMGDARDRVIQALNKYEKEDITDETDRAMYKTVRANFDAYELSRAKAVSLVVAGNDSDAMETMIAEQPVVDKMIQAISNIKKYNAELGERGAVMANDTQISANATAVIISLIVGLVVAVTGLILARRISSSLLQAVATAEAVAEGDLTSKINVTSTDEIGKLMQALNKMVSSLTNIVSDVRNSVSTIATASGEIASGNLDLSARTEAQAGSLEETASAMEELRKLCISKRTRVLLR
jgi:methyl-accepting chemotaxis protein